MSKKTRTNIDLVGAGSAAPAAPAAPSRRKDKVQMKAKSRRKSGGAGKKITGGARKTGK